MRHSKLFISPLIKDAFYYSAAKHDGQYRKGTKTPYFVHPAMVALGVSEYTKDENTIAAAVLHDVLEDCEVSVSELTEASNKSVSKIVEEVTAPLKNGIKKEWKEIKNDYLKLIVNASEEAFLIIAIDKMFNMTAYFDYALANGTEPLKKLFGGATFEDFFWYYTEVAKILDSHLTDHPVTKDYKNVLQYYKDKLLT